MYVQDKKFVKEIFWGLYLKGKHKIRPLDYVPALKVDLSKGELWGDTLLRLIRAEKVFYEENKRGELYTFWLP